MEKIAFTSCCTNQVTKIWYLLQDQARSHERLMLRGQNENKRCQNQLVAAIEQYLLCNVCYVPQRKPPSFQSNFHWQACGRNQAQYYGKQVTCYIIILKRIQVLFCPCFEIIYRNFCSDVKHSSHVCSMPK